MPTQATDPIHLSDFFAKEVYASSPRCQSGVKEKWLSMVTLEDDETPSSHLLDQTL